MCNNLISSKKILVFIIFNICETLFGCKNQYLYKKCVKTLYISNTKKNVTEAQMFKSILPSPNKIFIIACKVKYFTNLL